MTLRETWAIDALTLKRVRLVADHGEAISEVPRQTLRHLPNLAAGDVVAVTPDPTTGEPQWSTAVVMEREGEQRKADAARTLSKLQERDTGGDLIL